MHITALSTVQRYVWFSKVFEYLEHLRSDLNASQLNLLDTFVERQMVFTLFGRVYIPYHPTKESQFPASFEFQYVDALPDGFQAGDTQNKPPPPTLVAPNTNKKGKGKGKTVTSSDHEKEDNSTSLSAVLMSQMANNYISEIKEREKLSKQKEAAEKKQEREEKKKQKARDQKKDKEEKKEEALSAVAVDTRAVAVDKSAQEK
eukprot:gene12833-16343_t